MKHNNSNNILKRTANFLIATSLLVFVFLLNIGINACIASPNPNPPDLIINKTVDKSTANPGDTVVYTLDYQNIGNVPATGVVIKDTFNYINQQYLTFVSANPSPTSGTDTWNIGTLNPGQSGQINITARVSTSVPSGTIEIKNRGSIDSNETPFMYSNCANFVVTGGTSILNITKSVDKTTANPGDEIVYTLNYQNTGQGTANNVVIHDPFNNQNQNYLTFVSSNPSAISGNDTWNIGTLNAGQSGYITIRAKISNDVPAGYIQIQNRASIKSNETSLQYSNYASTWVYRESESISLNIDKLVRNITRGYGYWTTSVYSQPNDEIEFLIKINSIGNQTAENVKVKDSLPLKLTYVSGSTTVDGSYRSDGIVSSNGIYIGDLAIGNYREVKFKVRVASADNFGAGTTTLTNYGYTWANEVSQISNTAQVLVQKEETSQPIYSISISKLVRNISRGESVWLDSVLASSSQEIEFSIQVTNIGNSNLTNVKVWDNLPTHISIISNSTTIDGTSWGGDVIGAGLNLGTLTQGQTKTIKFRAKIAIEDDFGAGSTTLINTAYTVADNVSQISDQASVVIIKPGEVRGAEYVPTGANTIGLGFLAMISAFIALFVYCRTREEKLLEILNTDKSNKIVKAFIRFYFRIKFFITITKLRFKQIYW